MGTRKHKLIVSGLISLAIIAVLSLGGAGYFSTATQTQQAAVYSGLTESLQNVEEAKLVMVAPTEVRLGKLVILDVSQSTGNKFKWLVVPETEDFLVIDDGRRAVFSSGVPGEYMFIVACAVDDSVDVVRHVVRVTGVAPPAPQPDIDPVTPESLTSALSKQVQVWCAKIQSPTRSADALKLAGAMEGVAAQINAGTLTTPYEIVSATAEANRAALGEDLSTWVPFLRSLQDAVETMANDGKLTTPAQHAVIWMEIAKGLRYFAAK
jgi:hypothetical protein